MARVSSLLSKESVLGRAVARILGSSQRPQFGDAMSKRAFSAVRNRRPGVYKKCLGWLARVLQPLAEPHRAFSRRTIASKHGSSSGMGPWLA